MYAPACQAIIGVFGLVVCVAACIAFGYAMGRLDFLRDK
jgi:hypothetical protein